MIRIRRFTIVAILVAGTLAVSARVAQRGEEPADVVIIGAGIAGLTAALEAAHAGAHVLVATTSARTSPWHGRATGTTNSHTQRC